MPNPMEVVAAKSAEDHPHDEVPYFIAAENGWWKNMPTLFGVAQTKMPVAEKPPGLIELQASYVLNERKLPVWVLDQAHDFFKFIWDKQKTEASVYILYNRSTEEFKLFCPEQYVSMGGVNHKLDREKLPDGFTPVGTIHSHCNFSAYHSGTDKADMAKMPGIHITIGHVDDDTPEMVFALSMGHAQFDVDPEDIVDYEQKVNKHGYNTMPPYWEHFVKEGNAPWGNTGTHTSHTSHAHNTSHKPSGGYSYKPGYYNSNNGWYGRNLANRWDQQAWGGDEDDEWEQIPLLPHESSMDERFDFEDKPEDPFKEYEKIVQAGIDEIQDITAFLNSWGFHVGFSITYDMNRANEQLAAYEERQAMDGAPTP